MSKLFSTIAAWHYRPLPAWTKLLAPLEWGYRIGVFTRLMGYRLGLLKTVQVNVPVISIGNLTTGGTGKTPVVLALAEAFINNGRRVVILSRGYGAEIPVEGKRAWDPRYGDEAYFLQQQLPEAVVIIGKDRSKNAERAILAYTPDVIIMDDGFQHLKLKRTFNILLVDGERPFGNYHLLPLGPLREPICEISRADMIWVTKENSQGLLDYLESLVKKYSTNRKIPVQQLPFQRIGFQGLNSPHVYGIENFRDIFKTQACIAFSGIAQPEAFENDLRFSGYPPIQHLKFPDHHVYTAEDVQKIINSRISPNDLILTTEKDKVKVERLLPESIRPFVYTLKVRPMLADFRDIMREIFRSYDPLQHVKSDSITRL